MTYFILTLGCQMNLYDSEKIEHILKSYGLKSASEEKADFVIINACSVRQSAVDRIYGKLKKWQGKKVLITGCLLPHDRKKLQDKAEFISKIEDWPKILRKNGFLVKPRFQKPTTNNSRSVFVTIMTGCDNFCTYCAVPYTKGRETSHNEIEIIKEVNDLINSGSKQITLLGQNVNNFKPSFVKLLKKIIAIPGDFKIGFMTSNPWNFPDGLVDLVANEPKLIKEIHLPLQSGDDQILKKMNRRYSAEEYLGLIKNLKLKIKNLYLSTDIIVGFPTETKKQFENTLKLCKKAKFNKAFIAMYSPRPGTVSAQKYPDDVPQKEKKRRWRILDKLINS